MARDLSVEVREFTVEALSTAPALVALVGNTDGSARAYGPSVPDEPEWPWVRTDLPTVTPEPDGCGDGSRYTFRVHGFAKGDDERNAARLGAAIAATLDELSGDLGLVPAAAVTDTVWTGTQVFRDTAEATGWHAVVSVYCRVSG